MPPCAPLLVIGVGNPSRGDDALGPLFIERMGEALAGEVSRGAVELLTDFQLQIEHALDLQGRARVVFVDASVRAAPPFEFSPVAPRLDASCSTHALSPEAVLATFRSIVGEPPESWVLAIRGERFELGEPLTARAGAYLEAAVSFFVEEARGRSGHRTGRRLTLEGTVQGVGFRPWVYRVASGLGLTGEVWNTPAAVVIEAFGAASELDTLVRAIQRDAPPGARIRGLRVTSIPARDARAFVIGRSETGVGGPSVHAANGVRVNGGGVNGGGVNGGGVNGLRVNGTAASDARVAPALGQSTPVALTLPPDLATCDECSRDVADASDRHHGYAFTSCTACGPRFAIARALPYDRATTTLGCFTPCPACAAEYGDPSDRRFHAQTVACPRCGPRLWLADPAGRELPGDDAIETAAEWLRAGKILGVHGLGAFHLVCDARNSQAIAELRRRKRRDLQPFAVMAEDLTSAEALAELDPASRAALVGAARPIVLTRARPGALAPEVNGPSRRTGVMLPYTPLHQRLLARAARPLVVTSGNPSGGPAVIDAAEACTRLGALVDGFLLHDRPIARRVEDSVVAATPVGTRVLRRARGFAPAPIVLPAAASEPILAVGGHLKNTACIVIGDLAYLTPHLGDLGLIESERAWRREVEGFERLLGVEPQVIAHDLHPDYATTRLALERPARRHIGVQHHAAHVLAAVAELHIDEPVVGVAFDGSGFGDDGTSWGAEILIVDGGRWTRAASFRPLPLPGGERAIREVWRAALGALHEAFGAREALALAARLPVFQGLPQASLATVSRMIEERVGSVPARGMGRWFDAIGALTLALPQAGFEGHVAIALEEIADPGAVEPYPFVLPSDIALEGPIGAAHEVDLRPAVRALVPALLEGAAPSLVAARFHHTIVLATSAVVARVLAATGIRRVVLTGGSFQNQRLERGLSERLGADRICMARQVPVNDGGLSLGQAWAAVLALADQAPGL
jgi:hydrogenase maturation protein HypF